ncbi:MAG: hypothetical protein WD184_04065 [Acidimicrobiia bacterium]
MIPTVLLTAFLGAILWPARAGWVVAGISVGWLLTLVLFEGSGSSPADLVTAAALGVINAAFGFAVGWAVRRQVGERS